MPALREAYPELTGRKGVEVFRRKWLFYFKYCASGFSTRALGDHILTITREVCPARLPSGRSSLMPPFWLPGKPIPRPVRSR